MISPKLVIGNLVGIGFSSYVGSLLNVSLFRFQFSSNTGDFVDRLFPPHTQDSELFFRWLLRPSVAPHTGTLDSGRFLHL